MKVRGLSIYAKGEPGHHVPQSGVEYRHRRGGADTGGNLRAAVFGVNDGLISNASLILGMAGAAAMPADAAAGRCRGPGRWCVFDGGRRIRVGAFAAGDVRIPDRTRARRLFCAVNRAISAGALYW